MLALTLSSSAFVAPLTPAGRHGVAVSMIGGRDGQVNAGGNGKWAPAWKTKVGSGMPLCRNQGLYGLGASAAQAADWPRLAEARGGLRHDLALKGAPGEPTDWPRSV